MGRSMSWLGMVGMLLATASVGAESEHPAEQHWSLAEVCRLDSVAHWTGPWSPADMTTSPDAVAGEASLACKLNVEPRRRLRIERNFVADCFDGFRNMMAFGMVDEDFSAYRGISFQYRTDAAALAGLIFRVYDREGGWLEWSVPQPAAARQWRRVVLAIPARAWPQFNHHRVGGFVWEVAAGAEPLTGTLWLDDVQLHPDGVADAVPGTAYRPAPIDHAQSVAPPPLPAGARYQPVHLVMNMTGEIGNALYDGDAEAAIERFAQAAAVFRDVPGLEYFFAAEAWRIKRDSPDWAQWQLETRATHVALARWCEQQGVGFYLGIGQAGDASLALDATTVAAVLAAAPATCRGVLMGEFSIESNGGIDEVVEIMKLLKPRGLKLLYFQQSSYWFGIMMPHGDAFRAAVLAEEFRDVFVPMWENLLPSAQGLCLGTMLGLWQSGMANDWGVSAQSWGYANMNWGGTSDQPGDLWLRMFLSVASWGGRYIEIEPKWAFDGENVPGQIDHFKQWAHNLRWVGRRRAQIDIDRDPSGPIRALRLFNRLVRDHAVVAAAAPADVAALPAVGFQAKSTRQWGPWGVFHRGADERFYDGCCPNAEEMSRQTPAGDAFAYLYRSNQLYDQTLPRMPYGLVSIWPQAARTTTPPVLFPTDGNKVEIEGRWHAATEARPAIEAAYAAAAEALPFYAAACTWSAVKLTESDYLVTLIDPEERFPKGVETVLEVRLGGAWQALDGLTGARLAATASGVPVTVPPAGFRLVRVQLQP